MRAKSWLDAFRVDPKEYYAAGDLMGHKRLGGVLWLVGGLLICVFMPLSPPTQSSLGAWGWLVAGSIVLITIASAVRLLRFGDRVTPDELYFHCLAAPSAVAVLVWLGGPESAYQELYLLSIAYASAVHPPRRVAMYLVPYAACVAAPLVWAGWSAPLAAQIIAHLLIWIGLGYVIVTNQLRVRRFHSGLDRRRRSAHRQARVDPLTGLGNRRAFDEDLARLVAEEGLASVVIADLSDFKAINDTYGHLAGDEALRAVGQAIAKTVRGEDRCYRWGGDEFALLLPGSGRASAELVCARLADAVRTECADPAGRPLELDCGTADWRPGMDPAAVVSDADEALLELKGSA